MKTLIALTLIAFTTQAQAYPVPRGYVSPAVRSIQLQQQRAADAAAAQAQANKTGQPAYANGGVYLPSQPVVTP